MTNPTIDTPTWQRWFAWYPVPVHSAPHMRDGWRCFRYVERRCVGESIFDDDDGGTHKVWEYRLIDRHPPE